MLMDSRLEFANAEDGSQSAGTFLATNQVDLDVARDMGNGQPLYLVIQVDEAFASSGSATVQFRLRSDSTAAINATTSTGHIDTGAEAFTVMTAGHTKVIPLPLEGNEYERFLGVQLIVGTAATTAGTYSAFITAEPHGWKAYADAEN
jgi:hypothetical protein